MSVCVCVCVSGPTRITTLAPQLLYFLFFFFFFFFLFAFCQRSSANARTASRYDYWTVCWLCVGSLPLLCYSWNHCHHIMETTAIYASFFFFLSFLLSTPLFPIHRRARLQARLSTHICAFLLTYLLACM